MLPTGVRPRVPLRPLLSKVCGGCLCGGSGSLEPQSDGVCVVWLFNAPITACVSHAALVNNHVTFAAAAVVNVARGTPRLSSIFQLIVSVPGYDAGAAAEARAAAPAACTGVVAAISLRAGPDARRASRCVWIGAVGAQSPPSSSRGCPIHVRRSTCQRQQRSAHTWCAACRRACRVTGQQPCSRQQHVQLVEALVVAVAAAAASTAPAASHHGSWTAAAAARVHLRAAAIDGAAHAVCVAHGGVWPCCHCPCARLSQA
jgi:hypothetical protein